MGFFDEYPQESGGGVYVKAEEKSAIAQAGIPFVVTGVVEDNDNAYEGKPNPRYVLSLLLPNPETGDLEERKLGFPKGTVESRDKMLGQLSEYLASDKPEEVSLKLAKVGRAFILQQA